MTTSIFYLFSIVLSATGIFALWQLGLKRLLLDNFRDSLFLTRDRLYLLARQGKIPCDSPAYRSVELFINRTIRYAHRFTFLSFAMTAWHLSDKQKEVESYDLQSRAMMAAVGGVKDEAVRSELMSLVTEVSVLLPRYIAKSSLMFMIGGLIYVAFRSVSPLIAKSKDNAIKSFEVEAFREENFRDKNFRKLASA